MAQLIFGKYEILRRLAVGGMGEVFLAKQVGVPGFERLAILKSLLPDLAEQPEYVDQFLDEARVAATLNHPNIVGIFEVGLWEGVHYIAMEHIHGVDLSKLIVSAIKLGLQIPLPVAACIIRDAALGLAHAHEAKNVHGAKLNIVHRDISPQNIMVRGDGVTKVVDFGIAKAANRATRTQTGISKGKLPYMPPEQVMVEELDARCDQWALGVVFWELACSKRLFRGANDVDTINKIMHEPIPLLSSVLDETALELGYVVERMLQRNPQDRYASCTQVAQELNAYLGTISRQIGEVDVSECVKRLVGDELDKRMENLSPQENLILPVSGERSASPAGPVGTGTGARTVTGSKIGARPEEVMTSSRTMEGMQLLPGSPSLGSAPPARSKAPLWVGGGVAAAGVALALVMLLRPQAPVVTEPPSPPVVSALVPVVSTRTTPEGIVVDVMGPAGASIAVDGVPWPAVAPTTLPGLAPGAHVLDLKLNQLQGQQRVVIDKPIDKPLIRLTSNPPHAAVWLGDKPLGTTPLDLDFLMPDAEYELQVSLRGYATENLAVVARANERSQRTVNLRKSSSPGAGGPRAPATSPSSSGAPAPAVAPVAGVAPVAADAPPGMLSLTTDPWARLFINDKPYGSTPVHKLALPPGTHKVRLVNADDGIEVTRTITIESGKVSKNHWPLK